MLVAKLDCYPNSMLRHMLPCNIEESISLQSFKHEAGIPHITSIFYFCRILQLCMANSTKNRSQPYIAQT